MSNIRKTAATVPQKINGFLLPNLEVHLSEIPPNSGNKKSAKTLSAAMMAPEMVSFMEKVLVKINGITLLYICQNAQMDKNAKPILTVCFVLSFNENTPCGFL